jgi:cytochrome d ubiquinol oxidase subunit I
VAQWQAPKLAAMEGQFRTEAGAPLRIGGIPDEEARTTRHALEIPYGLSLLAFHDPRAVVKGLNEFPRDHWPPVLIVHVAFQVMVALGTFMALVSLWAAITMWVRGTVADNKWLLRAIAVAGPMGFICIEAGWTVTEVGRQPWIIYGVLRTADAVTPMPGLIVPFIVFTLLYFILGAIVIWLLRLHVLRSPTASEEELAVGAVGGKVA